MSDIMIQLGKLDSTVSTTEGRVERSHTPYKNNNLPGELSVAELKNAEELLMKGLLETNKKAKNNTANGDGRLFSIVTLDNGKKYVKANVQVTAGTIKRSYQLQNLSATKNQQLNDRVQEIP